MALLTSNPPAFGSLSDVGAFLIGQRALHKGVAIGAEDMAGCSMVVNTELSVPLLFVIFY